MEFLQKHKYYSGLGGVVVVYILAYLFLVLPVKTDLEKSGRKLRSLLGDVKRFNELEQVPTEEIVEYYNNRKAEFEKSFSEMKEFFENKDQYLEEWFPEIKSDLSRNGDTSPRLNRFQAVYSKERRQILQQYIGKTGPGLKLKRVSTKRNNVGPLEQPDVEDGATEEDVASILFELKESKEIALEEMKSIQKKFLIVQEFLKMLEASGTSYISDLTISEPPRRVNGQFVERIVNISGMIDYENIPTLTEQILNNKKLMLELTGISTERVDDYQPKTIPISVRYDQENEDAKKKFLEKNKLDLPGVKFNLKTRVWDYEILQAQ